MKWIFGVLLVLLSNATLADSTSNKQLCIDLAKKRDAIRKQLNQNSNDYLNHQYKATFEEYSRLCKDNAQNQNPYSVVTGKKNAFHNPFSDVAISDMSSFAAMYNGEKQSAWQAYYKIPKACRVKNPSTTDFVTCSENKTKQKQAFEVYWSSKMASANKAVNYDLKPFSKRESESALITPVTELKNGGTPTPQKDFVKVLQDNSSYLIAFGLLTCFLFFVCLSVWLMKWNRAKNKVIPLKITPKIKTIDKYCPYCLSPVLFNQTTQEYCCSDAPKCQFSSNSIIT